MNSEETEPRASTSARAAQRSGDHAIAAWIDHLNDLRRITLIDALQQQDVHLHEALFSLDEAIIDIRKLVTSNRGGTTGMHGFIAEIAESGIGNARRQIARGDKIYEWVNNNGPLDLVREGIGIQQKFSMAGGSFGLGAVAAHLRKYPDFISEGHRYQIPKDHYEIIRRLYLMPHSEAATQLSRSGPGPSLTDWHRVHAFFEEGRVPFDSLEPSLLDYRDVQRGTYGATIDAEQADLLATDKARRHSAHRASQPTLRQGLHVSATAGVIEGSTALIMGIMATRRTGKQLKDFTQDDWTRIARATGMGTARGAGRGFSLYALTNTTATSAAAASAIVTAAFGIAQQAHGLRCGNISEQEFLENAELLSLEAAVGALSATIGQAIIPVPVLGAVIGSTVATVMHRAVADALATREAELIGRYCAEQRVLDERHALEYRALMDHLDTVMSDYLDLLDQAFSPDIEAALTGSIALALSLGVAQDDILDTPEKTEAYFLH